MIRRDTIVSLSSGSLPSGIAVIRISGPGCALLFGKSLPNDLEPRKAILSSYKSRLESEILDQGLVLWFPAPHSYTGEDCLEFHAHGGRAVVSAILNDLCSYQGFRLAEAGEYSRRAFENGRIDLTEVDGIADLISSETEQQRKLSLSQSQGALRILYDEWRKELIFIRAMIEAEFDFSDEEDVPEEISQEGFDRLKELHGRISAHLSDNCAGEIIRDGFQISLLGRPNAGKSSLLNALSKRDVAIVTAEAGTTRDVLDVKLDINGYAVVISDTAGIRETDNTIEREGIRRAHLRADESDLVIWLSEIDSDDSVDYSGETDVLCLISKDDDGRSEQNSISCETGHGMDSLLKLISERIETRIPDTENALITRKRYRDGLVNVDQHLARCLSSQSLEMEMKAEELRLAADELGRISGKIDVEDLLDVIFSEFCVGK